MAAFAVMVKTPGFSPVKSRLAEGLGVEGAEKIYRQCLDCMGEILQDLQGEDSVFACWAVAEESALESPLWAKFPRVHQNGLGLGERMASVINELRPVHGRVALVGADSPQLGPEIVRQAFSILEDETSGADVVLGPSVDGGFYLIAMLVELPLALWNAVEYSRSDTLEQFVEQCRRQAPQVVIDTKTLPILCDLDQQADLAPMLRALKNRAGATARQLYQTLQERLNHATI